MSEINGNINDQLAIPQYILDIAESKFPECTSDSGPVFAYPEKRVAYAQGCMDTLSGKVVNCDGPKETYSREEVTSMLCSLFVFSGANSNQGLRAVIGKTFGDKANHILNTWDKLDRSRGQGVVSATMRYSKSLESQE